MDILSRIVRMIDLLNDRAGRFVAWAAVAMVLVQFAVVMLRYTFGYGSIMMQESVIYLHAILFMVGAGYTLLHEGHVRVDIFYRDADPRRQALVDMLGAVLFVLPVTALIAWASQSYIVTAWSVLEGSRETSGIQAVFLLKTAIWAFCALVGLQGIAMAGRSWLFLRGIDIPHPRDRMRI